MTILDLVKISLQNEKKLPQDSPEVLRELLENEYREYVKNLRKGEDEHRAKEYVS